MLSVLFLMLTSLERKSYPVALVIVQHDDVSHTPVDDLLSDACAALELALEARATVVVGHQNGFMTIVLTSTSWGPNEYARAIDALGQWEVTVSADFVYRDTLYGRVRVIGHQAVTYNVISAVAYAI